MKRTITLLALSMVLLTASAGSMRPDDITRGNTDTKAWAQENEAKLRTMTRAEWRALADEAQKKAAYGAFTPEQRVAHWRAKFDEVRTLCETDAELRHIQKAEDFVCKHTDLFAGQPPLPKEQLDEVETFFKAWNEEAVEQLQWSPRFCSAILNTLNAVLNRQGDVEVSPSSLPQKKKH